MKLDRKLNKNFLTPIVISIIISIIMTIILTIVLLNSVQRRMQSKLKSIDDEIVNPLVQTSKNIFEKKFSKYIYSLELILDYYTYYKSDIPYEESKNNNSINSIVMVNNGTSILNNISISGNTYLDYGLWHVNDKTKDYNSNKAYYDNYNPLFYDKFLKEITTLNKMNLIFKSIYEVFCNSTDLIIPKIYFFSPDSELYYSYPISTNITDYSIYTNFSNPNYCLDRSDFNPSYYYLKCQMQFVQTTTSYESNNTFRKIHITTPFKKNNQSIHISICIKAKDEYLIDNSYYDNMIIFCIDAIFNDIIEYLDYINKKLNGYIYILKVNETTPIYYPGISRLNYYSPINRFEFDVNTTFFIHEYISFLDELGNLVKSLDKTPSRQNFNSSYFKNATKNYYNLFPIRILFYDDSPSHFFSIIYLIRNEVFKNFISQYFSVYIENIVVYSLIMLMIGFLLIFISWYLIQLLSVTILKPIQNLKNLIKEINPEEKTSNKENGNNALMFEEEEEEVLDARSIEIDYLFNIIIKLKNVLQFTSSNFLRSQVGDMIEYINSKYTFKSVNNCKGVMLCDSNIGNLSLKLQKYDKAIFHLTSSLIDINDKDKSVSKESDQIKIKNKKSHVKAKFKNKQKFHEHVENEVTQPLVENSESKKTLLLESRYPKLIFAFKKFFRYLSKLMKDENQDLADELICYKESHTLEHYENTLLRYLELAQNSNDKRRICEALLEYNEFLISYKFKTQEIDEEEIFENSKMKEEIRKKKKEIFYLILKNFEEFDTYEITMKSMNNQEYLKNFLEVLKTNKKRNFELIEIPFIILAQKSNFLKGMFCKYSGNYGMAVQFFKKSSQHNLICDGLIIHNSLKQLIKIINIFVKNIDDKIKNNPEMKVGVDEKYLKLKKLLLKSNEIFDKKKSEFSSRPKDIILVIEVNKSMVENSCSKFIKSLKTCQFILENYITESDRFCLFTDDGGINAIISLTDRNVNTHIYFDALLESILDPVKNKEYKGNSKCNLKHTLGFLKSFSEKKSLINQKWIILLVDRIILDKEFRELIFNFNNDETSDFRFVIISLRNNSSSSSPLVQQFLIDIDSIHKLKNIFKCVGVVNKIKFHNERYDSDKRHI